MSSRKISHSNDPGREIAGNVNVVELPPLPPKLSNRKIDSREICQPVNEVLTPDSVGIDTTGHSVAIARTRPVLRKTVAGNPISSRKKVTAKKDANGLKPARTAKSKRKSGLIQDRSHSQSVKKRHYSEKEPTISRKTRLPGAVLKFFDRTIAVGALSICLSVMPALFKQSGEFVALCRPVAPLVTILPPFELTNQQVSLEKALKEMHHPQGSKTGLFVVNLENGEYVDINGEDAFSAASVIKIPIMVSFLLAVENGECSMTDRLTIDDSVITSGSGYLQWRSPGSTISAKEAAQLMIVFSDNTATNMIINLVGGMDRINRDMERWGLTRSRLNNYLVDIEGTNLTSPKDMVHLLAKVERGDLLSAESREFMYDSMANCRNRYLLPVGIGPGASIVHKTGTLGSVIGDAGLVTAPDGKKFVVAIQVARRRNDKSANMMVRKMSELIYNYQTQGTINAISHLSDEPGQVNKSRKNLKSGSRKLRKSKARTT